MIGQYHRDPWETWSMVPLTVVVPAGILANITLAGIVATVILA
jgi:hypothetical protein